MMQILVFVSKWIGLECLESLVSTFPDDQYTFVVSDPDADLIIDKLNQLNYEYKLLNNETIELIKSKENQHYDWLLNLWGGYIFKEDLIIKAKNAMNIHPSFLPYGRGMDPVVWAIRYREPAGVTLHKITAGVDEGPIIYQEEVPYEFPTKGNELYDKVVERCCQVFSEQWSMIRCNDEYIMRDQKVAQNTVTHRRKDLYKDNILNLDEDKSSHELILRLLAHDFGDGYSLKLIKDNRRYSVRLMFEELDRKTDKYV